MIEELSIFNEFETESSDLRSYVLYVALRWKSSLINFTIVITNWLTITKYTSLKYMFSFLHCFLFQPTTFLTVLTMINRTSVLSEIGSIYPSEQLDSSTFFGRVCVVHLLRFLCYVMYLALFVFAMCLVPNVACFSELSILAFIHSITHIVILIFLTVTYLDHVY
jgi:hypothetical protein